MEPWSIGDEVSAIYWSPADGGRWSRTRRSHRVTSIDPFQGVEFWYEGFVEGQLHRLDPDSATQYIKRR